MGVGAGRAFDYFESDTSVDARCVGREGHSSYGEATLIAYESRNQLIRRGRRRGELVEKRCSNWRIALDGRQLP
jgi:hypothetical protein